MSHEYTGYDDYFDYSHTPTPPDPKIVQLVQELRAWGTKFQLDAVDVLNMMIDCDILSKEQAELINIDKSKQPKLPTRHLS